MVVGAGIGRSVLLDVLDRWHLLAAVLGDLRAHASGALALCRWARLGAWALGGHLLAVACRGALACRLLVRTSGRALACCAGVAAGLGACLRGPRNLTAALHVCIAHIARVWRLVCTARPCGVAHRGLACLSTLPVARTDGVALPAGGHLACRVAHCPLFGLITGGFALGQQGSVGVVLAV